MEILLKRIYQTKKKIMEVTKATVSDIDSDWLENMDQSEVIFELFNKFFSQVRSVRLWLLTLLTKLSIIRFRYSILEL